MLVASSRAQYFGGPLIRMKRVYRRIVVLVCDVYLYSLRLKPSPDRKSPSVSWPSSSLTTDRRRGRNGFHGFWGNCCRVEPHEAVGFRFFVDAASFPKRCSQQLIKMKENPNARARPRLLRAHWQYMCPPIVAPAHSLTHTHTYQKSYEQLTDGRQPGGSRQGRRGRN